MHNICHAKRFNTMVFALILITLNLGLLPMNAITEVQKTRYLNCLCHHITLHTGS